MPARSCSPREGHLEALCRIFEYAQNHLSTAAALGCSRPAFPAGKLAAAGWPDTYGDAEEEDPPGKPQERGNGAEATMLAGAARAGSLAGRRPQAGATAPASKAPATWRSKRQGTAEASTFGSELAALRAGMEMSEC